MKKKQRKSAVSPKRDEDYSLWYQNVVKAADLAEISHVRGCMVIKPWGYGLWEQLQRQLDAEISATGCENAYFPLFIPLSYIEKEAAHVEGFAKEMAVVTHHRVEEKDGRLIPTSELDEPLIVRPTSETIIGKSFARWIHSYRDLPLKINQWANVVRWEMRPRVFLRTTEFLWQEGHTAHMTREEAWEETCLILNVYRSFAERFLAIPVIDGEKPESERFPGAERSICIEAMMQDRRALQAGTSHYLGQNFAKAAEIRFQNQEGELEYVHTTSWGVSTRMIGALIMVHGDDDGLCVPPAVAPKHIVIVPVIHTTEPAPGLLEYVDSVAASLGDGTFQGRHLSVQVDRRDVRSIDKRWEWLKKGVPLLLEVGPRDQKTNKVTVTRRDRLGERAGEMGRDEITNRATEILGEIQNGYYERAKRFLEENITEDLSSFEELRDWFAGEEGTSGKGGFVRAKWSGDPKGEEALAEMGVTVRCLPFQQRDTVGKCIFSGAETKTDAILAKAY